MLIPSYAAVKEEFGIPESLIAIPDAFFVLISAFFALIWGYYTDRVNRTKLIFAGAFSWTIGMLLTGFSLNLPMLILSRMLSGAGLGCVLPVGYSIISDTIPPDERSGWFGLLAILSSISNGVGQGLSSFIGPIYSWRFPFFLLSGISIVVVFLLFFIKLPYRGASEKELMDLSDLNLEYSYRISKDDLREILGKKTNQYLIIQGFFSIIPGTIFVFFMTSMFSLYYFNQLPQEIRLQTATIFAGMVGIGYILGNIILSYIGDVLFRRNKKNRVRLATVCMILTVPICLLMLFFITPVDVSNLNITYPDPISTIDIGTYLFQTIGEIFSVYPNYVLFLVFALIGSILSSGPVANRNAVMIDINYPEHKGTAASFFNLSEQVGKGLTLLISYILIILLGSIINMMIFAVFFWIPAAILWFLASRSVKEDMENKSRTLKERQQITLIDYIFELDIQMDRAIQKIQDSKYYILTDKDKFLELMNQGIKILNKCEKECKDRSITNIEQKAIKLRSKAKNVKREVKKIYRELKKDDIEPEIHRQHIEDLRQIRLRIGEWEKSTFGTIQTYYEDAYLKILEARLLRNTDLIKSLLKIYQAIEIYHRVKHLLNERIDHIVNIEELSEEDSFVYEKEQDLFKKSRNALWATVKLKDDIEDVLTQLKNEGIKKKDLEKTAELTSEYHLNLSQIILDTFGQNKKTKENLDKTLNKIEKIFEEYDKIYELKKLNVF
ncbi:MAG: MFS transporter [Candidatus Lokiarchaeota archaeon]|nr:MFS transporter [Candidatus Lokiarchaeota archaeon]MBD3201316.1 MFS transporter [Candidatus Lokiarchaeota archaeon]